jgi:hypothetical protein
MVVHNVKPSVELYALLDVPHFENIFVYASLEQLSSGLKIEHGVHLGFLYQLLDVAFLQRARSKNGLERQFGIPDFVEKEASQESTIGFFDDAVDDVNHVLDFPVLIGYMIWLCDLAIVGYRIVDKEQPLRLPLLYSCHRVLTTRRLLYIRVREPNITTCPELSVAVIVFVLQIHFTFP